MVRNSNPEVGTQRPAPVVSGFLPPKAQGIDTPGSLALRTSGFKFRTTRKKVILKCCGSGRLFKEPFLRVRGLVHARTEVVVRIFFATKATEICGRSDRTGGARRPMGSAEEFAGSRGRLGAASSVFPPSLFYCFFMSESSFHTCNQGASKKTDGDGEPVGR